MFHVPIQLSCELTSRLPLRHRHRHRRISASSSSALTVPISTTSKNHSIQSLCRKGKLKQAIHLLSDEENPTQHTYELLIQSCAQKKSISDAITVHKNLTEDGFDQDPFLATKLINMYAELGSVQYARQVFDNITDRTIYVWNAIFRALSLLGDGEEVLRLYRRMNLIGMPSDRFTYTYVLKACVVSGSELSLSRRGKEVHAQLLRRGYETHLHIMTTLVDMYAKFGRVESASLVFSSMPVKNLVSWSAMIACFAKNGRPFEALELFREMMRESVDVLPNSVTMVSVIQACAALSALEQGKLIHGYIIRNGLDSVLPVMNALVTMYARCGDLKLGENVFNQMEKRDVVSWNSLISSYAIHGLGSKALATFQAMVQQGYVPETKAVLYDVETEEKERVLLGHSEKLAVAFGLINCRRGETIRISKNLRLCEDCHSFTKFMSKFADREIMVRDINRFHHFKNGECSCRDYW